MIEIRLPLPTFHPSPLSPSYLSPCRPLTVATRPRHCGTRPVAVSIRSCRRRTRPRCRRRRRHPLAPLLLPLPPRRRCRRRFVDHLVDFCFACDDMILG